MCDWKNVITTGLAAGVVMLAVGLLLMPVWSAVFPNIQGEYASGLFRPWNDPLMTLYFAHPFVLGLAMAYLFEYMKPALKIKGWMAKGFKYGFLVWLVAGLPGMWITYASFNVSLPLVLSWTASGFLELVLAGASIAKLWK